jgi:hypothetical protein
MKLPRAILFDLDDTILVAFGPAQSQWQRTIAAFADQLGLIEATRRMIVAHSSRMTPMKGRACSGARQTPSKNAPQVNKSRIFIDFNCL